MGCDIHFYVEKKVKGKWISADQWEKDEDGKPFLDYKKSFYHDRNYNLFAILADVRNGCGFAGIRTGEGFEPISNPRGLPIDVSKEVKREFEAYGTDGHSHSYFTVKELMEYDWTQTTKCCGYLTALEFFDWHRWRKGDGEAPESYRSDVSGGAVKKISISEMVFIKNKADKKGTYQQREDWIKEKYPSTYTCVEWKIEYYKEAETFLGRTLPRLWRLGAPEDVRIVFFFDN